MEPSYRKKLSEFKSIISKMPREVCCSIVLPELNIPWAQLRQAVKNARLPMSSMSIAQVLTKMVSRVLPEEEIDDIVSKLRIQYIATSPGRTWHTIFLQNPTSEDMPPFDIYIRQLPNLVLQASRKVVKGYNTHVQVNTAKVGDFIYISVQQVAPNKECTPLYVATPPGEQVAFVSSLGNKRLIQAVANGLGFKTFSDAKLSGPELSSLLQIIERTYNTPVQRLVEPPVYDPQPVITKNGIDYTNEAYDKQYVEDYIGPNPPLLKTLEISSTKPSCDERIDKDIKITMKISSPNVAETIKCLAERRAIPPTSGLFKIFDSVRQNRFETVDEEDEM